MRAMSQSTSSAIGAPGVVPEAQVVVTGGGGSSSVSGTVKTPPVDGESPPLGVTGGQSMGSVTHTGISP